MGLETFITFSSSRTVPLATRPKSGAAIQPTASATTRSACAFLAPVGSSFWFSAQIQC